MKDDSDIPDEPSRTSESYLPDIIGHLLKRRREVKKLLKVGMVTYCTISIIIVIVMGCMCFGCSIFCETIGSVVVGKQLSRGIRAHSKKKTQ